MAINNNTSELINQVSEALRSLAEVASEAANNAKKYYQAWEKTMLMWNIATAHLGQLAAQVGLNKRMCLHMCNRNPFFRSVGLGDWPPHPVPAIELDHFLKVLLNDINELVQQLKFASVEHARAANVLQQFAKALEPEAAMQKLAEFAE
jgi:hypothetical protein